VFLWKCLYFLSLCSRVVWLSPYRKFIYSVDIHVLGRWLANLLSVDTKVVRGLLYQRIIFFTSDAFPDAKWSMLKQQSQFYSGHFMKNRLWQRIFVSNINVTLQLTSLQSERFNVYWCGVKVWSENKVAVCHIGCRIFMKCFLLSY